MQIPNWLIPSGELIFSGSEKQLHNAIRDLGGKSPEGKRFSCSLGGGAASFRFKMVSVFVCSYDSAPEGFRICWQVRPALSALVLFGALAAAALVSLVTGGLELSGTCACLLALLLCLYAIQRGDCIRQFEANFSR